MTAIRYRKIPDYPGYQAGSDGSIWTCWYFAGRDYGWRLGIARKKRLRDQRQKSGHFKVTLAVNGKRTHRYVHALVLFAFRGPRPFAGAESRHVDGDPGNNRPRNLRWGTHQENSADRTKHGRVPVGESNGKSKITERIVKAIVTRWKRGDSVAAMSQDYKVQRTAIYGVLKGRTWRHVTGIEESSRTIPRN